MTKQPKPCYLPENKVIKDGWPCRQPIALYVSWHSLYQRPNWKPLPFIVGVPWENLSLLFQSSYIISPWTTQESFKQDFLTLPPSTLDVIRSPQFQHFHIDLAYLQGLGPELCIIKIFSCHFTGKQQTPRDPGGQRRYGCWAIIKWRSGGTKMDLHASMGPVYV